VDAVVVILMLALLTATFRLAEALDRLRETRP
jgi:hypothetical protein